MNRDVCEHFNPVDLPCDRCKREAMNKGIAEHTARFDIAALRTFGRSAPPPEGVITPMLLKAADDMEEMLEELLKLRAKEKK